MFNEKEKEIVKKTVMTANGPQVVAEPTYVETDNRWIKVYVVQDTNQYYIDIFAANELGFIGYEQAKTDYNRGGRYFLLTPEQLDMIRRRFQERIIYLYFANGKALDTYSLLKEDKINFYGMDVEDNYIKENPEISNYDDKPKYEQPINDVTGYQVDNFDEPKTM